MATPTLTDLLKQLDREGRRLEAQAVRAISRAFSTQDAQTLIREVAAALLSSNPTERFAQRERLLRMASALWPALPPPLLTLTTDALTIGGNVGAGMLAASGAPAALTLASPAVLEAARAIPDRLTAIWGDARADHAARVGRVLTQALSTGGTKYPVRAEIQAALNVSRARAQLIASTEVLTALSSGSAAVWDQARDELDLKLEAKWVSARDSRVRESHRRVNGEVRPYGKAFSNGLTRPHQPGAPAREVVRCRCSLLVKAL